MATNLDMDCLRTLVEIADSGSFAAAGARVGRSLPAVSQQVERLSAQAGARLFQRDGRRMVLTAPGERLLSYARRILETNDAAVGALGAFDVTGTVRLGAAQDVADAGLPDVLRRFAASHPGVRLEVRVDNSRPLIEAVDDGSLDLALTLRTADARNWLSLTREPMVWIGHHAFAVPGTHPLPLAIFPGACTYREAALTALDAGGIDWEIVYESPSLSGLRAAVSAGLAVTVRTTRLAGAGLRVLDGGDGLPDLPHLEFGLLLARANPAAAVERLAAAFTEAFAVGSPTQAVSPAIGQ